MADEEHVYGEVDNVDDLRKIFAAIRCDDTLRTSHQFACRRGQAAVFVIDMTALSLAARSRAARVRASTP